MEFVEGKIEEEKVLGGVVFPKTLNPPCGYEEYGTNELLELVRAKHERLNETHIDTPQFYLGDSVSVHPMILDVWWRHLDGRRWSIRGLRNVPRWLTGSTLPMKSHLISLYTSIMRCAWALEKIECSSINFNKDGSAEFVIGPMNPIRQFGERRVWFNTILGYSSDGRDININFGDGSQFPLEALEANKQILDENCVDLKWQKGDVLLVDNLLAQHARRPGKPPRVIFVSLS